MVAGRTPSDRLAGVRESIAGQAAPGRLFGYLGFDDVYTPYFVTGDWVFVTHTYDGSVARVYVDGTLLGERTITLTTQGDPFLTIGARYATEAGGTFLDHYKGVIDDVRIWNRSLSQSEVQIAYAAPEPSSAMLLVVCGMMLVLRRRRFPSRESLWRDEESPEFRIHA